jgi:ribosomal protein S6
MSTTEDHKESTVYELGYLVLPSIPADNVPNVVSTIVSSLEKTGGKMLDSEAPFLEGLAYSMSKTVGSRKYVVDEAYIGWMKFEAESSMIAEIKIVVEKMEEILRILLIKAPRETEFTFAQAFEARRTKEEALNNPEVEVAPEVAPEVAVSEPVVE